MDQFLLIFLKGKDYILTMDGNNNENIKSTKYSPRKRQFNMNIVSNAGTYKLVYGLCYLVFKGTGKHIYQAYKYLW